MKFRRDGLDRPTSPESNPTDHPEVGYAVRQTITLSQVSALLFAEMRDELEVDERFPGRATCSTVVEFLIWHYKRTAEHVRFDQFKPETKPRGRPRTGMRTNPHNSTYAPRPSQVREEARRLEALDRKRARSKLSE